MSNSINDTLVIAIFSGVFDPITNGHLDIIRRGAKLVNKLIIGVGTNPGKRGLFSKSERAELIEQLTKDISNVEVKVYEGLTINFVREIGGTIILKGIRDTVDLRHELQQANTNRLAGGIETLFLLTGDKHALTSSTLIKEIAAMGGDVSSLVPEIVAKKLQEKLGFNKGDK